MVGAPGTTSATDDDGREAGPVPTTFVAAISNSYVAPACRPVTVTGDVVAVVVNVDHVVPPLDE